MCTYIPLEKCKIYSRILYVLVKLSDKKTLIFRVLIFKDGLRDSLHLLC